MPMFDRGEKHRILSMTKILSGLLSITFRKLTPQQIVRLTSEAGLDAIEWGGDIHVPPGDLSAARAVREMTLDAGLQISSYGSYYKVGVSDNFDDVLAAACELKASLIRVWAGDRGSAKADEVWWEQVIADTRRISKLAADENIGIAFEYHANTLTDGLDQAHRLLTEVNDSNVFSYWQPVTALSVQENLHVLTSLGPWLTNLHVFHWSHEPRTRLSLAEGVSEWREYIGTVAGIAVPNEGSLQSQRFAMLEFVKGDDPDQFLRDASVLKGILEEIK